MRQHPSEFRHIALMRLSALGDCVNAFGVAGAIAAALPQAAVTFITEQRFAGLFTDPAGLTAIPLIGADFSTGRAHAICALHRSCRSLPCDVLLCMQTSIRASLCSLAISAPLRVGYDAKRSRELQRLFVNTRIAPPAGTHVMAGYLEFARTLGIADPRPRWDFRLSPDELSRARAHFAPRRRILLLSPASAHPAKNWTADGYIQACRYAASELDMQVGLIGDRSPLCQRLCRQIMDGLDFKPVMLAGQTTLRELLAVIACADLMLSPDSGPLHMASALGTPVVGLFAIHSEKRVGPWRFMDLCVSVHERHARSELGGRSIPWRYRVRNPRAMEDITADEVTAMLARAYTSYIRTEAAAPEL